MESLTRADVSNVPKTFVDLAQLDLGHQMVMISELNKPVAERLPLLKGWCARAEKDFECFATMSPDLLPSKQLQHAHRMSKRLLPRAKEIEATGKLPREPEALLRKARAQLIKTCLMSRPFLRDLQEELEKLWSSSGEDDDICIPIIRNSVSAHLDLPREYPVLDFYAPTDEEMAQQLIDIYEREPELHARVLRLIMRACLFEAPRHPKPCSCVLCGHIAAVAARKKCESAESDG